MTLTVRTIKIDVDLQQLSSTGEDMGDNADYYTTLSFSQTAEYGASVDLEGAVKFFDSILEKVKQ